MALNPTNSRNLEQLVLKRLSQPIAGFSAHYNFIVTLIRSVAESPQYLRLSRRQVLEVGAVLREPGPCPQSEACTSLFPDNAVVACGTSSSAMAERPRELGDFKKARVNGGIDNHSLKVSHKCLRCR